MLVDNNIINSRYQQMDPRDVLLYVHRATEVDARCVNWPSTVASIVSLDRRRSS